MARRFYQEIHFKMNDLVLFYNMPLVSDEVKNTQACHHIEKLRCSSAAQLTPDECIRVRKCELNANKEKLFFEAGIDVIALQKLDNELRSN